MINETSLLNEIIEYNPVVSINPWKIVSKLDDGDIVKNVVEILLDTVYSGREFDATYINSSFSL